jgi:hypothetical protein
LQLPVGNSDKGAREEAFRAGFLGIKQERIDTKSLRVWEAFVVCYSERRSQIGTHGPMISERFSV